MFFLIFGVGLFIGFYVGNTPIGNVRVAGDAYFHAFQVADDVYLFDKTMQTEFIERMKKSITISHKLDMWSDKQKEEIIEGFEKTPPRAVVGNIIIFCDEKCQNFSLGRTDSKYILPIVTWRENKSGIQLTFNGILEEGWNIPRFEGSFFYSDKGQYRRSGLWFSEQPEKFFRLYTDNTGDGICDKMFHRQNDVLTEYHLNNLTFEKVGEESFKSPTEKSIGGYWLQKFVEDFEKLENSREGSTDNPTTTESNKPTHNIP
jgi:hypothetical protein